MRFCPVQLHFHYKQLWTIFFPVRFWPLLYVILELTIQSITMNCSTICQIWMNVFFPPLQLQHCLPVYLLLPRAHSQSSGGTQHHESPPTPHHKLSGPAPPGGPGALFTWIEGCTQEPFWQGEANRQPTHPHSHLNYHFILLGLKLLQ